MSDDSDVERLTARVDALEREVALLRGAAPYQAAPAPEAASVIATPAPTPVVEPMPAPAPRKRRDVESFVGGRGLLWVGAFLVVLGVAFFLEIAFSRGWIGPSMRVAMGILGGVALIAVGNSQRKRIPAYFADAIIGMGAAIAYLALYAAGAMFSLLPIAAVTAGMIVVTGTIGVLAYRENRQPLAMFGLVGGLLTPFMLGDVEPSRLLLFGYLGVLAAGAIALGELRNWRAVPIVSLIGTIPFWALYTIGTFGEASFRDELIVAVVLYALFASTLFLAWRKNEAPDGWRIAVAAINSAWFFIGLSTMGSGHDTTLAIVFLAIAALHLIAGARSKQRVQFWLATIALTFALPWIAGSFGTVASALVVATALHVAWIVEATLVGLLGARWNDRVLVVLAGAVFATVVLLTLVMGRPEAWPLAVNEFFVSLIGCAAGVALVRRELHARLTMNRFATAFGKILVDLLALIAISPEAMKLGRILSPHAGSAGEAVALSVAWALYAGALIVAGIRAKDAVWRWEGLVLFAITVLKVLVYDLTDFDIVFRVVSALVLGVVMLIVAYLYQARLKAAQ
jgi:uncharacterized membrane protein